MEEEPESGSGGGDKTVEPEQKEVREKSRRRLKHYIYDAFAATGKCDRERLNAKSKVLRVHEGLRNALQGKCERCFVWI